MNFLNALNTSFLPQLVVVEFEIEMAMIGQMATVGTLRVDRFDIVISGQTVPSAGFPDWSVDLHRSESFVLFLVEFHLARRHHSGTHTGGHVLQTGMLFGVSDRFLKSRMFRRLLLADRLRRSRIFTISHHVLVVRLLLRR